MLVLLSEYATASCAKSSPPFALSYTSRARCSRDSICSGDAVTGTEIRMCEMLYSAFWSGAFCCRAMNCSSSRGEMLMRPMTSRWRSSCSVIWRRISSRKIAIVDALLGERLRQVGEADAVALGDVVERAVQHFVGDLDAEAVGALDLDLLDDQPLQDLPAQHVARRQLGLLLTQARGDLVGLRIELADEHDAVVDHGRDAVEQLAAAGQLARLGERRAAGEHERHGQGEGQARDTCA